MRLEFRLTVRVTEKPKRLHVIVHRVEFDAPERLVAVTERTPRRMRDRGIDHPNISFAAFLAPNRRIISAWQ